MKSLRGGAEGAQFFTFSLPVGGRRAPLSPRQLRHWPSLQMESQNILCQRVFDKHKFYRDVCVPCPDIPEFIWKSLAAVTSVLALWQQHAFIVDGIKNKSFFIYSCPGSGSETLPCASCPVTWAEWGAWGSCSSQDVSCLIGSQSRTRTCLSSSGLVQASVPCLGNATAAQQVSYDLDFFY